MTTFSDLPSHVLSPYLSDRSSVVLSGANKALRASLQNDLNTRRTRNALLNAIGAAGAHSYRGRAAETAISQPPQNLDRIDATRLIHDRLRSAHDAYTNRLAVKHLYNGDSARAGAAYGRLRDQTLMPLARHLGVDTEISDPSVG